jgi:hypothetical protein
MRLALLQDALESAARLAAKRQDDYGIGVLRRFPMGLDKGTAPRNPIIILSFGRPKLLHLRHRHRRRGGGRCTPLPRGQ